MNFSKFYTIQERNDIKTNQVISRLVEKIIRFLKKYRKELDDKGFVGENGTTYWFPVKMVDKKYDDLYLVFMQEKEKTQAAFQRKQLNDGTVIKIIKLYVLKDISKGIGISQILLHIKDNLLSFKSTLSHELTHYFDDKKYEIEKSAISIGSDLYKYYNIPHEVNAYWNSSVREMMEVLKQSNTIKNIFLNKFDNFKSYFEDILRTENFFYVSLSPENKKRLLKRMYALWEEFREHFKGKY